VSLDAIARMYASTSSFFLKRFRPLLHYPNKWKTSRSAAMSHSLGFLPGNS
jgi:hypothetical protein